MKKIMLLLFAVMSIATLSAANPIKLVKGDNSIFTKDVKVKVVIDDHKTIIDKKNKPADVYYKSQGEGKYEAFVSDVDRAHASFVTYFNEKKKSNIKMRIGLHESGAAYTMKIKVKSMNVGGVAFGFSHKAGGVVLNGTLSIVSNKSGKTVCEYEFDGVKGAMGPKFEFRAISAYRYLADALLEANY